MTIDVPIETRAMLTAITANTWLPDSTSIASSGEKMIAARRIAAARRWTRQTQQPITVSATSRMMWLRVSGVP